MIDLEKVSENSKLGNRLIAASGIGVPVLASILDMAENVDAGKHPTIATAFNAIDSASLCFYGLFLCVFIIGSYYTRRGDHLAWKTIQSQVDILQRDAFNNHEHDLNDNHRVTLFKYKKWHWGRFWTKGGLRDSYKRGCWPGTGWLVPVIRSGHTGKGTKSVFWTPDEGKNAEGIAGKCWASDATLVREKLPPIKAISSDQQKNKYCASSNMPRWMLDNYCTQEKPVARNIMAFPIRNGLGDRWGVLIFDSMEPEGVDTARAQDAFNLTIEPIGVLLEGV